MNAFPLSAPHCVRVQVMRSVPNWGPTLIAVILTWTNPVVILYLSVLLGLTAGFAVAFLVAFGAEDPNFASFGRAFVSLVRVGMAQEWFRIDEYVDLGAMSAIICGTFYERCWALRLMLSEPMVFTYCCWNCFVGVASLFTAAGSTAPSACSC